MTAIIFLNPVIIAEFDGKCSLIGYRSFSIASSSYGRVAVVDDAVYSEGYIYVSGIYTDKNFEQKK
ncbi:hypothetical protein ACAM_0215 [Aeropyrum camini SY1 = JCM 12091]|uniref:Uncharacterized protein n=1 Tax=Aeropyrum camini SY1 = JCM 12091 TaxID=1198449 RepID=U3TED9_9CREN|nr:hypothetical protein ACAM_0215 [Aeropyrum camini SY1 = JCM 12091]